MNLQKAFELMNGEELKSQFRTDEQIIENLQSQGVETGIDQLLRAHRSEHLMYRGEEIDASELMVQLRLVLDKEYVMDTVPLTALVSALVIKARQNPLEQLLSTLRKARQEKE